MEGESLNLANIATRLNKIADLSLEVSEKLDSEIMAIIKHIKDVGSPDEVWTIRTHYVPCPDPFHKPAEQVERCGGSGRIDTGEADFKLEPIEVSCPGCPDCSPPPEEMGIAQLEAEVERLRSEVERYDKVIDEKIGSIADLVRENERYREALEHADLLRFWLNKLVEGATIHGDDMDAPTEFERIEAVTHGSLRTFIRRYDEARAALDNEKT